MDRASQNFLKKVVGFIPPHLMNGMLAMNPTDMYMEKSLLAAMKKRFETDVFIATLFTNYCDKNKALFFLNGNLLEISLEE